MDHPRMFLGAAGLFCAATAFAQAGAPCGTDADCPGELVCEAGRCGVAGGRPPASPPPVVKLDTSCEQDKDCGERMLCEVPDGHRLGKCVPGINQVRHTLIADLGSFVIGPGLRVEFELGIRERFSFFVGGGAGTLWNSIGSGFYGTADVGLRFFPLADLGQLSPLGLWLGPDLFLEYGTNPSTKTAVAAYGALATAGYTLAFGKLVVSLGGGAGVALAGSGRYDTGTPIKPTLGFAWSLRGAVGFGW